MPQSVQVHVIGASGRTGVALMLIVGDRRNAFGPRCAQRGKWSATGIDVAPHIADLGDPAALHSALESATHIVCCAHAHHAGVVIEAAPRRCTPDLPRQHPQIHQMAGRTRSRRAGRRLAFLASGRSGVMLHPTMIYGAQGEDNVHASQHCCTVCRSYRFPAEARRWFSRSTRTMLPAQSAPRLTTRGTGRNRW